MRPDQQDYQGTGVTVEVARKLDVPRLLLVVNKVPEVFDTARCEERVEQTYDCEVAAVLPHSDEMMALASAGTLRPPLPAASDHNGTEAGRGHAHALRAMPPDELFTVATKRSAGCRLAAQPPSCSSSRVGRPTWPTNPGAAAIFLRPRPHRTSATSRSFEAFSVGREPPVKSTIQDLERYAPRWAALVPANPSLRAALAHLLARKYTFTRRAVPEIRAALGLDDEAVKRAYHRQHRVDLETLYAAQVGLADWLRWG